MLPSSRLEDVCAVGTGHVKALQEQAPDAGDGNGKRYHYRHLKQSLLDSGHENSNPEILRLLLNSLTKEAKAGRKKRQPDARHKRAGSVWRSSLTGWHALTATAIYGNRSPRWF